MRKRCTAKYGPCGECGMAFAKKKDFFDHLGTAHAVQVEIEFVQIGRYLLNSEHFEVAVYIYVVHIEPIEVIEHIEHIEHLYIWNIGQILCIWWVFVGRVCLYYEVGAFTEDKLLCRTYI